MPPHSIRLLRCVSSLWRERESVCAVVFLTCTKAYIHTGFTLPPRPITPSQDVVEPTRLGSNRTMVLTDQQKEELHKALLDYLKTAGLTDTLEALERETGLQSSALEPKYSGLLEKKWTAVIRLQKKVLDLEAKLQDADSGARGPTRLPAGGAMSRDKTSWLPQAPARSVSSAHTPRGRGWEIGKQDCVRHEQDFRRTVFGHMAS